MMFFYLSSSVPQRSETVNGGIRGVALERGRPAPDTGDDGVGRGQPGCFGEAVGRVDGGLFGA